MSSTGAIRVAIVGAGVAGALLGRRLARAGARVTVFTARGLPPDATAVSGGLTRGFEPDLERCRLAADSVAELRADPELAAAAGYRELGSAYLLPAAGPVLDVLVKEVDARLPGSVDVVDPPWRNVPPGAVAVTERHAGYLSPAALRGWAVAGLPVEPAPADLPSLADRFDVLVLATGRWTPTLLAAAGLPGLGLRTKAIQYALHPARGWIPPVFVDELTGLWVRPAAGDQVLLGVPSARWDPVTPEPEPALVTRAVQAAYDRFGVRLPEPAAVVAAADAYADPPVLALRRVEGNIVTFTGGSGGAAKYALAASRLAAAALLG
jgi:glycine/D-amino acid oxidase-like deaminating enzyme